MHGQCYAVGIFHFYKRSGQICWRTTEHFHYLIVVQLNCIKLNIRRWFCSSNHCNFARMDMHTSWNCRFECIYICPSTFPSLIPVSRSLPSQTNLRLNEIQQTVATCRTFPRSLASECTWPKVRFSINILIKCIKTSRLLHCIHSIQQHNSQVPKVKQLRNSPWEKHGQLA